MNSMNELDKQPAAESTIKTKKQFVEPVMEQVDIALTESGTRGSTPTDFATYLS